MTGDRPVFGRSPNDPSIPPLVANEALTLETLLAAYTINTAYQLNQEEGTGSIEPGSLADLIVIARNLPLLLIPISCHPTRMIQDGKDEDQSR